MAFLPVVQNDEKHLVIFGPGSSLQYTIFGGDVRFQGVDLSNASFLHSNIDRVDFRYCSFGNKDEKLLGFIPHSRQNVLKDEIDADNDVASAARSGRTARIGRTPTLPSPFQGEDKGGGAETRHDKEPVRTGTSPVPTQKMEKKVREEKYEPVRRLYLELKKNFEEKRDWNTAGDFHYGEMECRKKMYGWSTFEGILVNFYFWLSGYGERPKRAFVALVLLVLFLFPTILSMDVFVSSFWSYLFNGQSFCL